MFVVVVVVIVCHAGNLYALCRSAGCILYELAALKRPFDGLTLMDVMYKITEVGPPPWPAAYSTELEGLFER